jgi:uncharacterized lipoprotein YddW (UPF0748 family)
MLTHGRRTWRCCVLLLASIGLGLGSARAAWAQEPKDHLGLWLTTVDSTVLTDPAESRRALRFLVDNGFGRAAVPLLTGGLTTWPVAPEHNPLGVPLDPRITGGSVAPLLLDLRRRGLRTVGWFEFGLMAPSGQSWLRHREDLLLARADGSTTWSESPGLDRVWLNPAQPDVQALLSDLVVDACRRLPLDVIQFDDHLGFPSDFGYDPFTLGLWRRTEAGAADPNPDPQDPAWLAWRSGLVTILLERIRGAMASACPGVTLSVAPNPQEFSYRTYLADWSDWVAKGLVDEVVVQIYRWEPGGVERELDHASLDLAQSRVPVRIGLLAGLRGRPQDPPVLRRMVDLVKSRGFDGVDLFFYESAKSLVPPGASEGMPMGEALRSGQRQGEDQAPKF